MTDSGISLADIAAVTRDEDLGSGWFVWVILIFALMGNGGFYGGHNMATSADVQRGTYEVTTDARFNSLFDNQARNAMDNAVLIKDAQYANMQNINCLTNSMNAGFNNVGSQLCCGFNGVERGIDNVKFENAQNTCAITSAIHQEGEMTRGLIQANVVQDLRDRLEEKDRLYQAANYTLANSAQTRTILDTMGRWYANAPICYQPYGAYGAAYGATYGVTA